MLRDGQGQAAGIPDADALDCVITNALIVDWTGIRKADVGIKGGRIAGIGKAGNPDVMAGVTPGMVVGVTTEAIAGEGLILTAGGIDSHIHFICPQQVYEALASGVTTFVGGGTGPATGTNATTCTPGSRHIELMLQATDALPMNFGFLGKGNTSKPEGLDEQIRGRRHRPEAARGLGLDAGGDRLLPRRRRAARRAGRDPHRHAERVGLRRRLDRRLQGPDDPHLPHRGRRRRARARHHQGVRRAERAPELDQPDAAVHGQHARRAPRHADGLPSPRRQHPRGRRLRREPHPRRDDRRRGRAARPRRDQHDVERQPGDGPGRRSDHAARGRRRTRCAPSAARWPASAAATTTCASAATSPSTRSTRRSPTAWRTQSDRSKSASSPIWCCGSRRSSAPSRSWSSRAASSPGRRWATPTRRSRRRSRCMMRPMFGAYGRATGATSLAFVSQAALDAGSVARYGLTKAAVAVGPCRGLGKRDMKLNDALPQDRGRRRDLHRARRRRGAARHRGGGAAAGAALLPVLSRPWHDVGSSGSSSTRRSRPGPSRTRSASSRPGSTAR